MSDGLDQSEGHPTTVLIQSLVSTEFIAMLAVIVTPHNHGQPGSESHPTDTLSQQFQGGRGYLIG